MSIVFKRIDIDASNGYKRAIPDAMHRSWFTPLALSLLMTAGTVRADVTSAAAAAPEPGSVGLLISGLALMALTACWRWSASKLK
jgi:hypothetical protein